MGKAIRRTDAVSGTTNSPPPADLSGCFTWLKGYLATASNTGMPGVFRNIFENNDFGQFSKRPPETAVARFLVFRGLGCGLAARVLVRREIIPGNHA